MSKTHKIDLELRQENKQCKLIIGELVKYVDDLTRTINRLTKSNDELKHKLFYYGIHIRHRLASPCKWKRTRTRKKIQSQIEEVSLDTRGKHRHSYHKKLHITIQQLVQNVKAQTLLRLTQKNATW